MTIDIRQVPRGIAVKVEILADPVSEAREYDGDKLVDVSWGGIGSSLNPACILYSNAPLWPWVRSDYSGGKVAALALGYAIGANEAGDVINVLIPDGFRGRDSGCHVSAQQIRWPDDISLPSAIHWLRAQDLHAKATKKLEEANSLFQRAAAWAAISGLRVDYDECGPYEKDYNPVTGELQSYCGSDASDVARIVSLLAAKHQRRVSQPDFNGRPIYADPGDTANDAYRRWSAPLEAVND